MSISSLRHFCRPFLCLSLFRGSRGILLLLPLLSRPPIWVAEPLHRYWTHINIPLRHKLLLSPGRGTMVGLGRGTLVELRRLGREPHSERFGRGLVAFGDKLAQRQKTFIVCVGVFIYHFHEFVKAYLVIERQAGLNFFYQMFLVVRHTCHIRGNHPF